MTYIFNKNHNRSHLPDCRAVRMMNFDKNAETVEEPRGHSCGWCGAGKIDNVDHRLDEYSQKPLAREVA
mgnify:CR=1 FL=1